ncbi:MAG: hypothetical protein IBX61_00660 [Thermoleophilia bacterium]|nr:hypothetical protein [Thermoleophilia bacterium]
MAAVDVLDVLAVPTVGLVSAVSRGDSAAGSSPHEIASPTAIMISKMAPSAAINGDAFKILFSDSFMSSSS